MDGGFPVGVELGYQGVEGIEFLLGAQAADKFEGDFFAIEVAGEVYQICFDCERGLRGDIYCGAIADIDHRLVMLCRARRRNTGSACVDTFCRDGARRVYIQIGCREADGAP